jgi:hypothetical protein
MGLFLGNDGNVALRNRLSAKIKTETNHIDKILVCAQAM